MMDECKCACCTEDEMSAVEQALMAELDDVLARYVSKPGGLIPALQATQQMFGYLPESALKQIAMAFDKPYSEVTGVVSFYSFFSTVPRGKHVVRVCLGTACYVRGGKEVLEALRKELDLEVGGTTPDRLFSLDIGRCFGACGIAPVVMVGDDVHQRVRPTKIAAMLQPYLENTDESEEENA